MNSSITLPVSQVHFHICWLVSLHPYGVEAINLGFGGERWSYAINDVGQEGPTGWGVDLVSCT